MTPSGSAAPLVALVLSLMLVASCAARADQVDDAARFYQEGNMTSALELVDRFLLEDPNDARGRFLKGTLLMEKGDDNQAIAMFTKLTEEYPELAEPYNNLGVIYARQGRLEVAKDYLERAVQAFPEYGVAYENLADVYAKLSEQSLRKAKQYDPANEALDTKLGLVTQMLAESKGAAAPPIKTKPPASRNKRKAGSAPASR